MRYQKALSTFNVSKWYLKEARLSVTGKMNNGIPSSSSDSAMRSNKNKNCRATFKIQMEICFLSLKEIDDALLKIMSKRPSFVLKPLKAMLNLVFDRISLRKLEYEMERADIPDDYIFF